MNSFLYEPPIMREGSFEHRGTEYFYEKFLSGILIKRVRFYSEKPFSNDISLYVHFCGKTLPIAICKGSQHSLVTTPYENGYRYEIVCDLKYPIWVEANTEMKLSINSPTPQPELNTSIGYLYHEMRE